MLLPLFDVSRWYVQRKPQGTIAVRHGQDTLRWDELERGANRRARAFAAKGVRPGDFVAIGLPNGNAFYGGTERQGSCIISGTEWLTHKGSVGKIGEMARLRIVGEDGNDVAPGETGEIYFLNNDGKDATYHYLGAEPKRRADGWESLGDIGRLDAEGYLYLGDRLADMVLRGGANIYPAEAEAVVSACPACAPAWWWDCPIRNSASACTPSSSPIPARTARRSRTAWRNS